MRLSSVAAVLACALALCDLPARAAEATVTYEFDIPQQPLDTALRAFAEQTGLQVARFDDAADGGVTVGPIHGKYTLK